MLPFFLARAREWWTVADLLRARVSEGDPVLSVWREAAWCHLLLTKGLYGAAVAQLRTVLREVAGVSLPPQSASGEAEVLSVAADVFERLRDEVSARYPYVFVRPAAA